MTTDFLGELLSTVWTVWAVLICAGIAYWALRPSNRRGSTATRAFPSTTNREHRSCRRRSKRTPFPAAIPPDMSGTGVKELNTPLPTWWVYTFYATILFAAVYCFFYPSWPSLSGHTTGWLGYTNRTQLTQDLAEQAKARSKFADRIRTSTFEEIRRDPELFNFALAGGRSAFQTNCMQCHGAGGGGNKGFPALVDDDWLWGGKIDQIHQTIRFGIRNTNEKSRQTMMPRFGADEVLSPAQVASVTDYVLSLSGRGKVTPEGAKIFQEQCVSCHRGRREKATRRWVRPT